MNMQCSALPTWAFLRKAGSFFALLLAATIPSSADTIALPESDWQPLTSQVKRLALRILPSSHTKPIWVRVSDKPLAPSRRSAEWRVKGVDQCWSQKERFVKPAEKDEALAAYDHARKAYRSY